MSPNNLTSALQSLLRHLLFDTSGTSCWVVQDASTQKNGADSAHVRASKVVQHHFTMVEREHMPNRPYKDERVATLLLHVHESDSSDILKLRVTIMWRHNSEKISLEHARSVVPNPGSGFVDWAHEIHAAASHLFDRIKLLHESCASACDMLLMRVGETPNPDEIEDESTQEPDSGPLDARDQSQP